MRRLAVVLLLASCTYDCPIDARPSAAMERLWSELAPGSCPCLYPVYQEQLECDPTGEDSYVRVSPEMAHGWVYGEKCVSGLAGYDPDWIAYTTLESLAHEMGHHELNRRGMDTDQAHTGPTWQPGGFVDRAYAKLAGR